MSHVLTMDTTNTVRSAMRLNAAEIRVTAHHLLPRVPCIFQTVSGDIFVRGRGAYDWQAPDIRDTEDIGLTTADLEPSGYAAQVYLEGRQ